MEDKIRIELTDEQKEKIREATGKDASAIELTAEELTAEELEDRVSPRTMRKF
jgi:DNA-binding MarR family transcriptional regulator